MTIDHRQPLTGGTTRTRDGATNPFGQSPDICPLVRWLMADPGRAFAIDASWRDDADGQQPMLMLDLYHGGGAPIAFGEAHADYGILPLFRDTLAKAPPIHREGYEPPHGGGQEFRRV